MPAEMPDRETHGGEGHDGEGHDGERHGGERHDGDFPPRMGVEEAREFKRRRRGRNIALLVALLALCLIFYGLSMVKLAATAGQ